VLFPIDRDVYSRHWPGAKHRFEHWMVLWPPAREEFDQQLIVLCGFSLATCVGIGDTTSAYLLQSQKKLQLELRALQRKVHLLSQAELEAAGQQDASFPAVASSTPSYSDFKGYPRQRKLERMALQEPKAEVAVERMRFVEGFLKRHCGVTDGASKKETGGKRRKDVANCSLVTIVSCAFIQPNSGMDWSPN
jgi:hypothetical protein